MSKDQKNFLFRHFEKMICGLVALGLVLTLAYVVILNITSDLNEVVDTIAESLNIIETANADPDEDEIEVDRAMYEERWNRLVSPPLSQFEIREVFWPASPQHYPEIAVQTEEEHLLEFYEPLEEGSVSVSVIEGEDVLSPGEDGELFSHPVHGNPSAILLYAGPGEGKVRITATGNGRPHIKEVTVDKSIRPQPLPPAGLTHDDGFNRGRQIVELYFEPNPANREKNIIVKEYRIYRKLASDLMADFQLVNTVDADPDLEGLSSEEIQRLKGVEETNEDEEQIGWELPEDEDTAVDPDVNEYSWLDRNIDSDEIFLYKVKAVGLESRPQESEFTEVERVGTPPVLDFFVESERRGEMSVSVAVDFDGEFEYAEDLSFFVGDKIEKVDNDAPVYFGSDIILIDFLDEALRRRPYSSGKVIYIDRKGEIKEKWGGYWSTGKEGDAEDPW